MKQRPYPKMLTEKEEEILRWLKDIQKRVSKLNPFNVEQDKFRIVGMLNGLIDKIK